MSPATGIGFSPKAVVSPTNWSHATTSGVASSASPNSSISSASHVAVSRSSSSERLAVDTSVTNAPHSRCTSQVSVVVTTPARVTLARSHAIFGAEK